MGNVIAAGLGQNPARQAAIFAGLPDSVGAFTVNKVCGSGLKAVMLADQAIRAGDASLVVAGGMESMSSRALPAHQGTRGLSTRPRRASRLHDPGRPLGRLRPQAHGNLRRALRRQVSLQPGRARRFRRPKPHPRPPGDRRRRIRDRDRARRGLVQREDDSRVARTKARRSSTRPSCDRSSRHLRPDGTITAGNASSISDGAAALLVASPEQCRAAKLKPIAEIKGAATWSQQPEWFTTAPVAAIRLLLEKIDWTIEQVDLFEINEAFAVVTMVAERELGIPPEKVNIYGGAVALGHPIGCSGARVLVTLLNALKRTGGRRGIASLCIGGGEAVALAVETLD